MTDVRFRPERIARSATASIRCVQTWPRPDAAALYQAYDALIGTIVYPLFIQRGEGSHIYDADGNRYLDWVMAYGALPLGHAHPHIVEAVSEAG